jgi:dephospho-CoA kinase
MTMARFRSILGMQYPDEEKRARADFVVQTGFGRAYSKKQVKDILGTIHAARNHP